jgi:hypothetical protein
MDATAMSRRWPWMLVAILGLAGLIVGSYWADPWWAWSWVGYSIVGGVVLWRQPTNPIGRRLVAIGLGWGLSFSLDELIIRAGTAPLAAWLEILSEIAGMLPWFVLIDLTLLFPTGKARSSSVRWVRKSLIAVGVILFSGVIIDPAPLDVSKQKSPLAVEELAEVAAFTNQEQGFLLVPALLIFALGNLVIRWRRAKGVERLQLQWFVLALVVTILVLSTEAFTLGLDFELLAPIVLNLLPLAIGIAVLRYRLFDIDRVISRSVGYLLVAGIIALIYGIGAVWLPTRLVGEQSPLFVAGSTLLAAALFNPLRRRVMTAVERRFHRGHYDAVQVVDRFSQRVLNMVDITHVTGDLMTVVSGTLQPTSVGLWVRRT